MTALTLALVLLGALAPDPLPPVPPWWWEVAKGVGGTAILAGVGWLITGTRRIEKRQVTHEHLLFGVSGDNGLRSEVQASALRIAAIEERNTRIDAVTEYEKQHYQGEERRMGSRRVRDVVRDVEEEKHS